MKNIGYDPSEEWQRGCLVKKCIWVALVVVIITRSSFFSQYCLCIRQLVWYVFSATCDIGIHLFVSWLWNSIVKIPKSKFDVEKLFDFFSKSCISWKIYHNRYIPTNLRHPSNGKVPSYSYGENMFLEVKVGGWYKYYTMANNCYVYCYK